MKLKTQEKHLRRLEKRGFALLTALFMITLLSLLAVAILFLSRSESRITGIYAGRIEAKLLAESASNLAIAQIRSATTVEEGETWTSQPGMIRRFGTKTGDSGRAEATAFYKLYSAREMVTTGASFNPEEDLPPPGWKEKEAEWVDLNKPYQVDTNGDGIPEDLVFPILDPRSDARGFRVADAPGATDIQPSPLPVRWLYLLKDGTLASPGESNGAVTEVASATLDNPVVGRIGLWVDDETCKLNINTASEPTPWDTPRCVSKTDLDYSVYQPALNEFQRYPGHPSMTALSPVLFPEKNTLTKQEKQKIYDILPRVVEGGSRSGTVRNSERNRVSIPDGNRLFASVDEILYRQDRVIDPLINSEKLARSRFFLTAHSRAPEINLHGRPRISCWPVHVTERTHRTPHDNLSAFCSTIGGKNFYFQRREAKDKTTDWSISRNPELYSYLQNLMERDVPGFGGSFATKWGLDSDQMLVQTLDYIRTTNLRSKAIGSNRRPVEPYTTNGQVVPLEVQEGNKSLKGFGRFHSISEFGLHFICNRKGPETAEKDGVKLVANQRMVQAAFLMEPFSPSQGFFTLQQDLSYEVNGLDQFKINGNSMGFSRRAVYRPSSSFGSSFHGRAWGGSQGVRTFIQNKGASYPFIGNGRIVLDAASRAPSMTFSGGTVVVKIFKGNSTNSRDLVQTLEVDFPSSTFPVPDLVATGTSGYRGASATAASHWWEFSSRYATTRSAPHAPNTEYADRARRWPSKNGSPAGFKQGGVFRAEDVVRSIVPASGDMRLIAGLATVPTSRFAPHYHYSNLRCNLDHLFSDTQGPHLLYAFGNEPGVRFDRSLNQQSVPEREGAQLTDVDYHFSRYPDVPYGTGDLNLWGDFDNGCAQITDGAYINKPDEGNVAGGGGSKKNYGYFSWAFEESYENMYSPNRMMPSPGMFGSLPTGVQRNQPWQTLLLRPQDGHPGEKPCPDHTFLDLFWMPVVEPYAISEPFSTAGKVNLNCEILPFRYVKRTTALHGLMKSEEPIAIPNSVSRGYKLWDHETSDHPDLPDKNNLDRIGGRQWTYLFTGRTVCRKPIDTEATLEQFDRRFEENDVFRSASEICGIHLVREGEKLSDYESESFWKDHVLTGDNSRERPYANLYSRLTTQSNTYRAHFWVESIKVARSTGAGKVDLGKDQVTGRYRGSVLIERYINPSEPGLPDFATDQDARADRFYRYRILEQKEFRP